MNLDLEREYAEEELIEEMRQIFAARKEEEARRAGFVEHLDENDDLEVIEYI